MKYIYDILLNFNETKIYEFYEWNENDEIEYFKKVPLLRVDFKTYKNIKVGNIIDETLFLDRINNIAEMYDNKLVRHIEYACILTDGDRSVGILLNKKGEIMMVSGMLLDEEEETIEIGSTIKEININIVVKTEADEKPNNYVTRAESHKMFFLNKEIDNLYTNKNTNKLKYLYYECTNQTEDDIDSIYKYLKTFINGDWDIKQTALYDLVRLSYSKK